MKGRGSRQRGDAGRLGGFRLLARVHAAAFARAPGAYIIALFWWVRRYRVRARHQFATLLGATPYAYRYWVFSRERAVADRGADHAGPLTVAIDASRGSERLGDTLGSLARAGAPDPLVLADGTEAAARLAAVNERSGWLLLLRAGDEVAPDVLTAYERAITGAGASRLIYADDDRLDPNGRRSEPHFKPRWNRDLAAHHDYLTHACAVRLAGGGPLVLPSRQWAEALVEAAVAGTNGSPIHLPLVLHHRRERPAPRLPDAAPPAISDPPLVSVIIPTRDGADLLRTCLDGLKATSYPWIEPIIVDNGSSDPAALALIAGAEAEGAIVLRDDGPFNFGRLNNAAARIATGSLLCLLNNDIEVVDPHWLTWLVHHAGREDLGAIGARLLYPDGSIQHAGVVIGVGNAAGHAHRALPQDAVGYFERARLPQKVSAVTAACLLVEREKFWAIDGFDEDAFPVAFNDVDLCLRLNARGWHSFYEPRATLIHHESKSRGLDLSPEKRARFARELTALQQRWHTDRVVDPFHHPALSRASEQFVLDLDIR